MRVDNLTFLVLILFCFLFHLSKAEETTESDTCVVNENGEKHCESTNNENNENNDVNLLDHLLNEHHYDCEDVVNKADCQIWYENNECEKNPGFMTMNCANTCGYCHMVDPKVRCRRSPKAQPAVSKPGDIDALFERIIKDFPQYNPTVLSRDPWIVTLDNVFTAEEGKRLIDVGGRNFKRSRDAGKMSGNDAQFEEIISDARTSYTDWCVYGCWDDPIIHRIVERAENITHIPRTNSEFFQVLRYNKGQYYVTHHDYIEGHLDLPIGPRLLTFFLYLSNVTEGGDTYFNDLDISVKPQAGKVVIWPSVLNENPLQKDWRTHHEARPVIKGVKYAANLWLHMYNFHQPYKVLCTG